VKKQLTLVLRLLRPVSFEDFAPKKTALNTLAAGLIQAVHKKQLIRMWLCG